MNAIRLLSKIVIICLILWAVYVSLSAFFGVQIYFPFRLAEAESIPYHRWQSVRVAVFLTLSLFMILHLLNASREIAPIKFLEIFLTIYTPTLAIFTYQASASPDEYMMVGVFGTVTALLHLANRADTRKYFRSKR